MLRLSKFQGLLLTLYIVKIESMQSTKTTQKEDAL
jgi:hypothetical protein